MYDLTVADTLTARVKKKLRDVSAQLMNDIISHVNSESPIQMSEVGSKLF